MEIVGVKYFQLEELVDKPYIDKFGKNSQWFLDKALVLCLDRIREAIGPLIINNWKTGGLYHESGLRMPTAETGAQFSQHKYGNAFDLKPQKISVHELFYHIYHQQFLYPQITAIENPEKTMTWLHVDSRWHEGDGMIIVEP